MMGFYDKRHCPRGAGYSVLSPREREVLQLLCEGLRPGEIAKRLDITRRTLHNHLEAVYWALDVHSRLEAVLYAYRHKLVDK